MSKLKVHSAEQGHDSALFRTIAEPNLRLMKHGPVRPMPMPNLVQRMTDRLFR